jgi:hypothetical protein
MIDAIHVSTEAQTRGTAPTAEPIAWFEWFRDASRQKSKTSSGLAG